MPTPDRKQRERAARELLIVTTARDLAEEEGWDAVTTRRLAARIEFSEPVLYSHFHGKSAIVAAVALAGFAEVADRLQAARTEATDNRQALAGVVAAYVDFAQQRPAQYDAMFTSTVELSFGSQAAAAPLRDAFAEIYETVRPYAREADCETLAETFWSALHGLVMLTHHCALRSDAHAQRLALLIESFTAGRAVAQTAAPDASAASRC